MAQQADEEFDLGDALDDYLGLNAAAPAAPVVPSAAAAAPPAPADDDEDMGDLPDDNEEAVDDELAQALDAELQGGQEEEAPGLSEAEAATQRHLALFMSTLSDAQMDRYEAFRRSCMPRPKMKKLIQSITGQAPSHNLLVAMCGVTKMAVGELIARARRIATEQHHTGPLHPSHVHRAYQALRDEGQMGRPGKRGSGGSGRKVFPRRA